MKPRTSRTTVTFTRPVHLAALDGTVPAGTYEIETEEEQVDGLSFVAYRRVSCVILVPGPSGGAVQVQAVPVDPAELDAVLREDT